MPGGATRQQPDQEATARFAQSLRGPESASAVPRAVAAPVASPFSLFGSGSVESHLSPDGQRPVHPSEGEGKQSPVEAVWDRSLQEGVKRLMVSEDQRSLRMDLDASLFPGVVVEVFEDAGAWVAQFTCSEQGSFDRLAAAADEMAARMAASLERDALWRVIAEGPAVGQVTPVESFSSAPGQGLR
jgi:hypothetical protein